MSDLIPYEWGVSPIVSYMDSLSYISKRILITDALHNREISAPFTKKEIITYAYKDAEESIFSASYNAIQGYKNDVYFIGEPAINPLTDKPNSEEAQAGLFGNISNNLSIGLMKTALTIGASIFIYKRLSK